MHFWKQYHNIKIRNTEQYINILSKQYILVSNLPAIFSCQLIRMLFSEFGLDKTIIHQTNNTTNNKDLWIIQRFCANFWIIIFLEIFVHNYDKMLSQNLIFFYLSILNEKFVNKQMFKINDINNVLEYLYSLLIE